MLSRYSLTNNLHSHLHNAQSATAKNFIRPHLCLRLAVLIACLALTKSIIAADFTHQEMEKIYTEVKTPYKFGLVVAPENNKKKYDCPTVFREGDEWFMTYVCYDGKEGKDGRGYETWLAKSRDLLHWQTLGRVLEFATTKTWDENQRGGFPSLIDYTWGGSYGMQRYKGRHWMTYIGGAGTGYEAVNAPLSIGVASTKEKASVAHPWTCNPKPLMSYDDKDAQWWEQLTQYKSTIYKVDKSYFGYPFVMFYNAGGKDSTHPKGERIGIALSKDMKKWRRYEGNPVFAHDTDGTITGDAQIVRMGDIFVMFYFSAYNPTRKYNAYNTFAVSRDLIHWTDWDGADLIIPSKPYDEMFAHKSFVVKHEGIVYHFYCAVNNAGQRGIALATSRHIGKSEVSFPQPDPSGQRFTKSLNENWTISFDGIEQNCDVPFNLDDYYGAVQKEHGNLHGESIWRKKFFVEDKGDKEYFIRFEGVGTYAEVILNGNKVGRYDIGRTTETVDITKFVRRGAENQLVLNISHPEGITDMPWVCGGCSSEWGFSEGSQPFGIFRPVTLEVTDKVRIEPFGIHVWSNTACDSLYVESELKNYSDETEEISLINKLCEKSGKQVVRLTETVVLKPGERRIIRQSASLAAINVSRWSLEDPYLYNVNTLLKRSNKTIDNLDTPFGFRTSLWPKCVGATDNCFYLNGKKTFINGTCEYEHLFGQSHAFTNEQIETRIHQVESAGFNAFRDAHQPHNLHYKDLLDKDGLLWWAQFSAHIWYDTPQFRESFKRHLRQWVKERRNSPSLVLWGLQNESTLPKDFAEECTAIIREMDPTCGTQRLVTTCNGGEGTDWNVVQNWSGTYGGDVDNYAEELKQPEQLLNGEYGAWRTLNNHTGEGYTEEKFTELITKKMRLAESAKDSICGQFQWLLCSHDNPGRRQPDEALRRIDKVGPFNYKGLFTIWDQPTDCYYAIRSGGVSGNSGSSGYSDVSGSSVDSFATIYRLNCGGDDYVDADGNLWQQDDSTFSHSWGDRFEGISSYQCSQTYNPDLNLSPLFQRSRFGRHELYYHFPAEKGEYQVDLYFVEPWYKGTFDDADYEGWRLFDVAINDSTVIKNLDIWSQVGYGNVYKRTVKIYNNCDEIKISFPKVKSGQAIISAIAISVYEKENDNKNDNANLQNKAHSQLPQGGVIGNPTSPLGGTERGLWSSFDDDILVKTPDSLLPPKTNRAITAEGKKINRTMEWEFSVGVAKVYALRFKYHNAKMPRKLHVVLTDQNGVVYKDDDITFLQTQEKITKRKMTSITTGDFVNAGTYKLRLTGDGINEMIFDDLTVE